MGNDRKTIDSSSAPEAVGPYSHAVASGGLLFCSGQIPLDPETGEIAADDAAGQAIQCLKNLRAVCEEAGTGLDRAVRLTIYTTELERFAEINDAYAEFFPSDPPARAAVGVVALPKGAVVEIDAVVAL
jgi:2-iminobutanoate/2-iminopropanoate deaminase